MFDPNRLLALNWVLLKPVRGNKLLNEATDFCDPLTFNAKSPNFMLYSDSDCHLHFRVREPNKKDFCGTAQHCILATSPSTRRRSRFSSCLTGEFQSLSKDPKSTNNGSGDGSGRHLSVNAPAAISMTC